MGSDAATGAKGGATAGSGSSSSGPSAISQAKALAKAQDEATTHEPVLLASVRRPATGARVHALPCTIVHDGPAAVSTYFLPKRAGGSQQEGDQAGKQKQEQPPTGQEEDGAAYEAQFRGRNLKGVKASLPAGMVGFVARETVLPPELADAAPAAAAQRYWALESEFQETVLWRHDLAPPTDHCIQQVQEWCTLARAIHEDKDAGAEKQQTAE